MKILITTLLAATGLAAAVPAAAQSYGYTDNRGNYVQNGYQQNGYEQNGYGQNGYDRDAQERWARDHASQGQYGNTYRRAGDSAMSFQDSEQMYVQLISRIDHERRDGDLDRGQAADYRRQADMIRKHAWHARERGAYDPQEVGARYAQLNDRMQQFMARSRYVDNRNRDYPRY